MLTENFTVILATGRIKKEKVDKGKEEQEEEERKGEEEKEEFKMEEERRRERKEELKKFDTLENFVHNSPLNRAFPILKGIPTREVLAQYNRFIPRKKPLI